MTKRVTWMIILGIHLSIALIALTKKEAIKVHLPKKIAVSTIQLPPPPPKAKIAPKPKPMPIAQIKKTPPKKVAVKKEAPKPISKPLPKPKPASTPLIAPPAPIKKLSIDQEKVDETLKKIVSLMQTHLQLPEFGKVKLKLTLLADGSIKDIVVLSQESVANKVYLETHLKELPFPPLEQGAFKKDEETFHITFCNST